MSAEFGIVKESCYFCGQEETIRFNEHFTFCPDCSAIYTEMIMKESNCSHMVQGVPIVIHKPNFRAARIGKPVVLESNLGMQYCSACTLSCVCDGW